jgi:phosphoglucosamine mutase
LVGLLEGRDLTGLRIVVDCANGAACAIAPAVLSRLGAQVHAIACEPDGANINADCGSTHPHRLAAEVVARKAHLGLALDGDADRLVAVDAAGAIASGDELLALFAADLADQGRLTAHTVVVTVMSNLGFRLAMAERGIAVRETPVGDRYVLEALDSEGLALGGEQSGHIVFRRLATTGDGMLTGLLLADLVIRSGRSLADLVLTSMRRVPQVLINVPAPDPGAIVAAPALGELTASLQVELGERGRLLLRASGTEPVVRVMVEAEDEALAHSAAARLVDAVEAMLPAGAPDAPTSVATSP